MLTYPPRFHKYFVDPTLDNNLLIHRHVRRTRATTYITSTFHRDPKTGRPAFHARDVRKRDPLTYAPTCHRTIHIIQENERL
jgi:hypothetical protein